MGLTWVLLGWGVAAALAYLIGVRWLHQSRSVERLYEATSVAEHRAFVTADDDRGALARWLFLAGYRSPGAVRGFLALCALALVAGAAAAYTLIASSAIDQAAQWISAVPGGIGEVFRPILLAAPWIVMALIVAIPLLVVRSARRRRVEEVEQDLPITLELLATLGQAGLGYDASLARILDSQRRDRPLAEELATFQTESLAGVPRVQCFRRLARRIDVTSMSIFVSALVQAEQMGAALGDVLRQQADDLRNRRREQALAKAQSLPVKLTFPLVLCFLPGIYVMTLGPAFYQFFQIAENVIQRR